MITLIKLLVLLFLSVLGYDTLNLFLQRTYNNEVRDIAAVIKTEEPNTISYTPLFENFAIGNNTLLIFIISLGVIALIILLFHKRHREEGTRIAEIVSQLKTLSECTKNLDKLNLKHENKNIAIDEPNNENDGEYSFNEEIHSGINSRNPSSDGSKSSDESDIEQLHQRNKFLVSKSKSTSPVFVLPNEKFSLFEDLGDQKIALANNTQENYFFNYETFNNPRHLFYNDSVPMKYILPEMKNEVTRNCDCNITKFEERLEEVECNLRSTREVTILWRNRIEQTEEELLELQQQINAMLLEKTYSKIRTLEDKRNRNELLDYSLLFPSLGAFKPLQIISELIDDTKKQVEEEQRNEEEALKTEESPKFSQKIGGCIIISSNENIVKEEKIGDSTNQNNILAKETELSKDQNEEKWCKLDKKEAEVLENEKSEKLPSSTAPETAEEIKDMQGATVPSTQETQTETISIVTETIFEYDFTTQTKKTRFKEIMPRVPSHIVGHRSYQSKKPRRPPPRCAYSVLTEQGK